MRDCVVTMGEITIDSVKLRLSHPDVLDLEWVGQSEVISQLIAAWTIIDKNDIPLNPRILGRPGVGKTTLAYAAAALMSKNGVYIFQCTMDTRPEDLIVQPVIGSNNKIEYHASALVTAAINGGICILDEGNRMSEKSWASLAPLLDKRRYVESIIAGIKIKVHKDFRVCVTMNTDSSTYEIPEYIDSRLQPKIYLDFPDAEDEFEILKYNLPYAKDDLLKYIVNFLQLSHEADQNHSSRDGINILRYYLKLKDPKSYELLQKETDKKPLKKLKKSNAFDPGLFELAVRQILDDEGIEFFGKYVSALNNKDSSNLNSKKDEFPSYKRGFLKEFDDRNYKGLGDFFDDNIDYYDEDLRRSKANEFDPNQYDDNDDAVDDDGENLFDDLIREPKIKDKLRFEELFDDTIDNILKKNLLNKKKVISFNNWEDEDLKEPYNLDSSKDITLDPNDPEYIDKIKKIVKKNIESKKSTRSANGSKKSIRSTKGSKKSTKSTKPKNTKKTKGTEK